MNNILEGQAFLFLWIGFLLLMSCGVGAFFLWGIRAGQFSRQDRARYLALQAAIPDAIPAKAGEEEQGQQQAEEPERENGRRDEADEGSGRRTP